jgi:hypothetical protein
MAFRSLAKKEICCWSNPVADIFCAKGPVAESSALAFGGRYVSAKEASELYEMAYSTFMKRLKDFVRYGEYPAAAFRVERRLGSRKREYWLIEVHPVLGIGALNRHFYPRLCVQ